VPPRSIVASLMSCLPSPLQSAASAESSGRSLNCPVVPRGLTAPHETLTGLWAASCSDARCRLQPDQFEKSRHNANSAVKREREVGGAGVPR
jgi:hypothetical protein